MNELLQAQYISAYLLAEQHSKNCQYYAGRWFWNNENYQVIVYLGSNGYSYEVLTLGRVIDGRRLHDGHILKSGLIKDVEQLRNLLVDDSDELYEMAEQHMN